MLQFILKLAQLQLARHKADVAESLMTLCLCITSLPLMRRVTTMHDSKTKGECISVNSAHVQAA